MKRKITILLLACSVALLTTAQNSCSCLVPLDSSFTFALPQCDDCSSANVVLLPFTFNFYGTNETSLWINNNGNISFSQPFFSFISDSFPNATFDVIAPFWADVSTVLAGSGRVYYKVTPTAIIIRWDSVDCFTSNIDRLNSFQIILTNGSDPLLPANNNIEFCYGEMQWTASDASNGINGFGGSPATVGVNKGDGIHYFQIGQFDSAGTTFFNQTAINNEVGWLANKSFPFNVSSSTNTPPINVNTTCDTISACIGDTTNVSELFLSAESNQTTTVNVNLYGLPGAVVLPLISGNPVNAQVQIINSLINQGCWDITFTAIDNGIPADTTVIDRIVCISNCGSVGIKAINDDMANSISIAPNPFSTQTTISFSTEQKNTKLKVTNVLGEEVFQSTISSKQYTLDMTGVAKGIYFVRITTAGSASSPTDVVNRKIVVQ